LQVQPFSSPIASTSSACPLHSPSFQYRCCATPVHLQRLPMTGPKDSPSCGQRRRDIDPHGRMVGTSPRDRFYVQQPLNRMVCLVPVGLKQQDGAVSERSWRGTEQRSVSTTPLPSPREQQSASTTPLPSPREQAKQTLRSESLQCRPLSLCRESFTKKMEQPSKEDGIMADTLQDLQFLEKLLSSNLDQGDMGNSEIHRTLFQTLVHVRKTLALPPQLGSAPSRVSSLIA